MKRILAVVCVGAFVLAGTACSSDNNKSSDPKEFCSLNTELASAPTDEQLDQIAAAAPDEIADEVQLIVDEVKKNGAEAQTNASEELQAAGQKISEYITKNCTSSTTVESGPITEDSQTSPSS